MMQQKQCDNCGERLEPVPMMKQTYICPECGDGPYTIR